jgi:hypothetical protein
MVSRRIRQRHRLLDAYVRVELEERGVLIDERSERPDLVLLRPLPEVRRPSAGEHTDEREDEREDESEDARGDARRDRPA